MNIILEYVEKLSNGDVLFDDVPAEIQDAVKEIMNVNGEHDYDGVSVESTKVASKSNEGDIIVGSGNTRTTITGKTVSEQYLSVNKYTRPGTKINKIKKLAVHYAGGAGCTADGVRSWFVTCAKNGTFASSHYVVGLKGEIIQLIPESEYSYCTNAANSYSISIENCHPTSDGHFNDLTYASLVALATDICYRHGLNPLTDIIRHYDVTGKECPLDWIPRNHPERWTKFKNDVNDALNQYLDKVQEKEDPEVIKTATIICNGQSKTFEVSFLNDKNYFPKEVLIAMGIDVSYDANSKAVSLTTATKKVNISFGGTVSEFDSVNIAGYNYVPVRVLEKLGAVVGYADNTVTVNPNSITVEYDSATQSIPSLNINNTNFVPLRSLENFGLTVNYDAATGDIEIVK